SINHNGWVYPFLITHYRVASGPLSKLLQRFWRSWGNSLIRFKGCCYAGPQAAMKSELTKQPFNIELALRRIDVAVKPFPKAALFKLAKKVYNTPFKLLIACFISIRTYDEVMLPTARKLFARAATPAEIASMSAEEIDALIRAST